MKLSAAFGARSLSPDPLASSIHDLDSTPVLAPNVERTNLFDSNSTRTESFVTISPDPGSTRQVDAAKARDHNGQQHIIIPIPMR